ncbi:hypothetical protein LXA43DRAFT_1133135 [Ganoderma leucocontextum]|nr:hypothetical protein LXA43DRAFT_1133135 [Ganoderma leucocontextum]
MSSLDNSPGPSTSTPEPKRPSQAKIKRPPFPFEYGQYRVRNMLPRAVLPRRLDPRCVAIESPTDIPLCWLGIPFSFDVVENYATNTGLGVPVTEGYHSRIPGSVDLMKTWLGITDNFYEDTGITLDIRDVWGIEQPVITFISNRQTCDITLDQHQAIEDLLEDMGYKKEDGPMWYLDRRELVCF